MQINVPKNDQCGWQKAYAQIDQAVDNRASNIDFKVALNNENDVTNLRYAFPIFSYLKRKNIIAKLMLSGLDKYIMMAKVFLSQMADDGALVVYNGSSNSFKEKIVERYLDENKDLSELEKETLSIIINEFKEVKEEAELDIEAENPLFDENTKGDPKYCYYYVYPTSCRKMHSGRGLLDFDLLRKIISEIKRVDADNISFVQVDVFETDVKSLDIDSKAYSYMYPSGIFPLTEFKQNDSRTKEKIRRLIEFYKNSTVNLKEFKFKFATALERNNITEIQRTVKDAIPSFSGNDFAELIFYFLLRNMYYHKKAFWTENITYAVDTELIKKTALDARSYAEGLWQLIENACVHSNGKTAFFGIRIYKANTETTMGNITKEANTRELLWKKYGQDGSARNNIFNVTDSDGNKRYRDFIEFYVLDDAVNNDGIAEGVLDMLHSNNAIIKERTPSSIAGVFALSEEDYAEESKINYYIQHYGMRWLHKHADNLDGIIQMFSPCVSAVVEYKGKYYIEKSSTGMCCYSNRLKAEKLFTDIIPKKDEIEAKIKEIKNYKSAAFSVNGYEENPEDNSTVKLIPYCNFFSTEYSILIPVSYKTSAPVSKFANIEELSFDCRFNFYSDVEHKTFDTVPKLSNATKEENVNTIEAIIKSEVKDLPVDKDNNTPYVYDISLKKWDMCTASKVELLAKALFKYIYKVHSENPEAMILFSIDFEDREDLIHEFIRIFSIFYVKQGKNTWMKNVQIALCSDYKNVEIEGKSQVVKAISFIIVGENLRTAYNTASNFVYYNADTSLKYISVLDYICPEDIGESKEDNVQTLCPFELVSKKSSDNRLYSFLEQMKYKITIDQRKSDYGCKLSDIYVKLGSKIIISNFYEAELLFHNLGNIKRFAYLIARDIHENEKKRKEDGIDDKKTVVALLGYENYSSILIQETERLLDIDKDGNKDKRFWVTGFRDSGKVPEVSFENVYSDIKEMLLDENVNIVCYTIVPVGATLTTFHKLHDSFKRGLRKYRKDNSINNSKNKYNIDFRDNYLLIAVGDCYFDEETDISKKYIQKVHITNNYDNDWNVAEVMNAIEEEDTDNKKPPLKVKYCIGARSKWYNSLYGCEDHQSSDNEDDANKGKHSVRPPVKVDKTSTLLSTIFQTALPDNVLDYYDSKKTNVDLLEPMVNEIYVKYGHIHLLDNHYQFFFDFDRLVKKPENKEKIIEWARGIKIDSKAFNIVISPLQNSNSVFLKLVLDNVFGNSLHLLHIDINNSSKEIIRTKFLYICNELKMIKNAYSKVNFYFVDDSICTGVTIGRAQKLLLMLCEHAGITRNGNKAEENFSIGFKKVILLINRNSYETARAWVNNPNEDWCGFINLWVPPYNTHADKCPACLVQEKFKLLEKRSATKEMVSHFKYNVDKHSKRTFNDFEKYMNNSINVNNGYYDWLHSYIVTHEDKFKVGKNKEIKQAFDDFENIIKTDKKVNEKIKNPSITDMFNILTKEKTKENSEDSKNIKDAYEAVKKDCIALMDYIVAKEHYYRLKSMNDAYREIIYNKKLHKLYSECVDNNTENGKPDFNVFKKELSKTILGLLKGSLKEENYYDRILAFVSYIKVISRDYIAKTYYVREAIFEILHCIFIIITEDFGKEYKINSPQVFKEYLCSLSEKSTHMPTKSELFKIMSDENYYEAYYNFWKRIRVDDVTDKGKGFDCRVVYRATKVVVHRLAQLNSEYIIKKEVIEDALKAYSRLCKKDEEHKLPSPDKIVKAYLASIKTATMSVNDDKMCFNLLELYQGWLKNE